MRIVAGLGLLLALVAGVMVIPEITTLENTGASLSGIGDGLKGLFNKLTLIMMALVIAMALGTVVLTMAILFNRR
ncbi:MAG: hypothetical protein ACREQA_20780 [Candidatus Binatia bacterium]